MTCHSSQITQKARRGHLKPSGAREILSQLLFKDFLDRPQPRAGPRGGGGLKGGGDSVGQLVTVQNVVGRGATCQGP